MMMQQPAANLQIQQQFEQLQQQLQQHHQQQNNNQLTSSASFNCMSAATAATTPTKLNQGSNSNTQAATTGQQSSPAFKSIFKNFRGSIKHQSNNSTSANNVNEPPKQQSRDGKSLFIRDLILLCLIDY